MQIKDIKAKNLNLPAHLVQGWLCFLLNKSPAFLISNDDYRLSSDQIAQFTSGITQLQQGLPLAYLTGSAGFWSLDFVVNEHTLVPRPDTEILVECVIDMLPISTTPINVLEMGTGSGCIAIALKHTLQQRINLTATDQSQAALKVAITNAKTHHTDIRFLSGDWYDALEQKECFDIILSNPPYISEDDNHLHNLSYEPISALTAKNNGLSDITTIINNAHSHLNTGGFVVLEHGYNQAISVQKIFAAAGFVNIKTLQDYGGNDRVSMGQLFF